MSDETTVTPEAPAETPAIAETTAPAEPAKAEPPVQQEPDWRRAYVGLQTSVNRLHATEERRQSQTAALVATIDNLKKDNREILKATGGDDAVRQSQVRENQALAQEAARRASTAAEQLMNAQAELLLGALSAVGVQANDPSIDWAQDAPDVETWKSRVLPSVQARIQRAHEERIASSMKSVSAKTAQEVKAEAEALTQRALKEQGVDKIDSARGSSSSNYVDRVKNMKYGTPEYEEWKRRALSGNLEIK